jgi:eukaryotic-like serine/threonine-protein kinase
MLRLIREEEPPRPSARVSTSGQAVATISLHRGTDPGKLSALMRGELDWIVMKSLEKDRTRRYESPAGLARDVERYLTDEPVEACPPSATYRLRKFARKHKAPLAVAALFAAALLAGTAVSSWQAVRATRAETVADERAADAEESTRRAAASAREAGARAAEARDQEALVRTERDRLRDALYFANANLIERAWDANAITQVHQLLEQQRPGVGERDRRGFEWYYRDRMTHQELITVPHPENPPFPPRVSADGRFVVAATKEENGAGGAAVYDLATGTPHARLAVDANPQPAEILWGPDSKRVVARYNHHASGPDRTAKAENPEEWVAYDPDDGRALYRIKLPKNVLSSSDWPAWATSPWVLTPSVVRFSADGKYLGVCWPAGGVLLVCDAATGRPVRQIDRTSSRDFAFSADGRRIAVQVGDAGPGKRPRELSLKVYDVVGGAELFSAPVPDGNQALFTFAPDGERLGAVFAPSFTPGAPSDPASTAKLWSIAGAKEMCSFTLPVARRNLGYEPTLFSFSRDAARLVVCSDASAQVFDTTTGRLVATLNGTGHVSGSGFNRDGTRVVVYSGTNACMFDVPSGKLVGTLTHTGYVSSFRFSADGTRLATAAGSIACVWNLGANGTRPAFEFRGHTFDLCGLDFHPDGSRLYTTDSAGAFKVWDISVDDRPVYIEGVSSLAFSGSAARLAGFQGSGRGDKKLTVWDTKGRVIDSKSVSISHRDGMFTPPLALGAGGTRLAVVVPLSEVPASFIQGSDFERVVGAELRVLDLGTGKLLLASKEPEWARKGDTLVFSRDGTRLAWDCRQPHRVKVFDVSAGTELRTIDFPAGEHVTENVAFSPDGRCIATVPGALSVTGTGRVWDVFSGRELVKLEAFEGGVHSRNLVYSPDGTRLAAVLYPVNGPAGRDGSVGSWVVIWDAASGRKLLAVPGHSGAILRLAFSPDGRRIATATSKSREIGDVLEVRQEIKFWDVVTGNELMTLKGPGVFGIEDYLEFSADGHRLFAARRDSGPMIPHSKLVLYAWDATPRPVK